MAETPIQKYLIRMIIEIIGTPDTHVKSTLELMAKNFNEKQQSVKVIQTKIAEPRKIEKSEKFYSGFIDLEVEVDGLGVLIGLVLDWMPSSIEIIEPEEVKVNTAELTSMLNDFTGKLHKSDSLIKHLKAQQILLQRKMKELESGKDNNTAEASSNSEKDNKEQEN